jgi:transglutaminase-like putative cysteine protease
MGENGGFYYHAWPEVYLGESQKWVPVDPTFGQFPADASHVKLVEGDLDKQVEILGVMGRLGFKLVESR